MKTMCIILLMVFSSILYSQDDFYNRKIECITDGFVLGSGINLITYEILFRTTGIKQKWCRVISCGSGIIGNSLLQMTKQKNKINLDQSLYSGIVGSLTISILIGKDSKRDKQRKKIKNSYIK